MQWMPTGKPTRAASTTSANSQCGIEYSPMIAAFISQNTDAAFACLF
jgi:hypothetical protein